ncbi:MAG: DUF4249 domain-containing protein [Prolixibacteraceae bacterium]
MKLNFQHIFLIGLLALWGCEDYYVPEIDQMPNSLVVEAMLTDQAKPMTLKLSRTNPFDGRNYLRGERDANVTLYANSGESFSFHEYSSGNYISYDTIRAVTGEAYHLRIVTSDGEDYRSDQEIMMAHNEIDKVHFSDSTLKEINYNYWGEPFVTDFKGINISVVPEKPMNTEVGYLYRWSSLINYYVYATQGMLEYSYFCWKKMNSNSLYVYDYNESDQGNNLILDNLHFLSYYTVYPNNLDSSRFEGIVQSTYASSFYYYLEQYTITKKGADFWKSVKKQSDATGKLFDPVEEEIESNFHCLSNPDLRCFGIFNTASYSKRIVLVDIGIRKVESYFTVQSFPVPKKDDECMLNEKADYWY